MKEEFRNCHDGKTSTSENQEEHERSYCTVISHCFGEEITRMEEFVQEISRGTFTDRFHEHLYDQQQAIPQYSEQSPSQWQVWAKNLDVVDDDDRYEELIMNIRDSFYKPSEKSQTELE